MHNQPAYQIGDRIGGRYQVYQSFQSGIGHVYGCLDMEKGQPYVLKTVQGQLLKLFRAMKPTFLREADSWARLDKHPHIVRCFQTILVDDQPFTLLEWVAGSGFGGPSLRLRLQNGPLILPYALQVAIDICRGLAHAQARQPDVVHRDLKPENILFAPDGLAKITDFGFAHVVAQADGAIVPSPRHLARGLQYNLMGSHGTAGTPPYMAPEQWHKDSVLDARTDSYAIGILLFEMITGRTPYTVEVHDNTNWLEVWQQKHEHGVLPPFPPIVPASVADLITACLSKQPEDRPADAAVLLATLLRLYEQEIQRPPRAVQENIPFSAGDYTNRGITYAMVGRLEWALSDYAQALQLDAQNPFAYNNRGMLYARLGKFHEAVTDFSAALQLDRRFAEAYNNRGSAYDRLGQTEQALADFNRALDYNPDFADVFNNRGLLYDRVGQTDRALANYGRALQLQPTYATAYFNRGNTYLRLERYGQAIADFTQAVRFNPKMANAYNNRGLAHERMGQAETALTDFHQAVRLNPQYAMAYFNAGANLVNRELLRESLPYFEKAAQLGLTQATQAANQVREALDASGR